MPSIVIVNLEKTMVDNVLANTIADIKKAVPETVPPYDPSLGINAEPLNIFTGWIKRTQAERLDEVLEVTRRRAPERVATWAQVMLPAQQVAGHELGLWSGRVAQPVVDAHADGLEDAWGIKIDHVFAPDFEQRENTYTGRTDRLQKHDIVDNLRQPPAQPDPSQPYDIELIADSFSSALPVMEQARHKLAVNPEHSLETKLRRRKTDTLYWNPGDAAFTRVSFADESVTHSYALDTVDDRLRFLADLRRKHIITTPNDW